MVLDDDEGDDGAVRLVFWPLVLRTAVARVGPELLRLSARRNDVFPLVVAADLALGRAAAFLAPLGGRVSTFRSATRFPAIVATTWSRATSLSVMSYTSPPRGTRNCSRDDFRWKIAELLC